MEHLGTLVERAQRGNLEAYATLVRRFQDMAYGFAYSLLGDFHLAQDAAQEAFVEAYRCLADLRTPAAFPGWFRRIVFKHADRLTRRKRVPTVALSAAAAVPAPEPPPPDAAERHEMARRVLAAVAALPEHQRVVTTLFYIDGYSQNDIAEFLDVPVTTVKKRLAHSRDRLRSEMMTMVDQTLKAFPLPDRFADVVVQMNFVTQRVNPLADAMRALSDDEMLARAATARRRLAEGEERSAVLAEVLALVREASRRAIGQAHYDVQLVAAMILDQGWIAEEATGEGKTITCFPAIAMAALEGLRVHVATVNDYLAARDAATARAVLGRLGISVGHIAAGMDADARREAYQCDVTYGHAAELGFDSLRDQRRPDGQEPVQGRHDVAVLDEADSILLDEARTPLIISRAAEGDVAVTKAADAAARDLIRQQAGGAALYERDPQSPLLVRLTRQGLAALGRLPNVAAAPRHAVEQALRAHLLYRSDEEYLVEGGRVVLLDEATGRPRHGRRWSDGLHQAIEAKEGVEIRPEAETLASITFQEYFGLYRKLAGVTGTAKTQAEEFRSLYGLDVAAVPTRRPVNRVDYPDRVFADAAALRDGLVDEVLHVSRGLGRPVLVVARTIAESEELSQRLGDEGIPHEVLNARPANAAREADIVAAAGQQRPMADGSGRLAGAVTIATNMAGRGTDVALGPGVVCPTCRVPSAERLAELGVESGPPFPPGAVKCCIGCLEHDGATGCAQCFKPKLDAAFPERGRGACRAEPPCGLHVIGIGRHEARRLDNQVRARAGSQGRPGSSRFLLSLDDELVRLATDEMGGPGALSVPPGGFVEDERVGRAIEHAQQKLEERDADIRRRLSRAAVHGDA